MRIVVNGQDREVPSGTTLGGLMELLKVDPRRVVVEFNREIINRSSWEEHVSRELKEGDALELVQLVGGG
ncbi:MAG: sulfur carrier protein ThiS [bacterium]|nr:sulfur carrier protein ThiS [bacterium]